MNITLSVIFSLPLNQIMSFKYAVFFADDLWLYYYDKREYSGVLEEIFFTITSLERMKFRIFSKVASLDGAQESLPLSDYKNYTRSQFVAIEGSEQVLIQTALPFFLYMIPQNIALCLLFYALFRLTSQYKLSVIFRRFSFFYCALLQILL